MRAQRTHLHIYSNGNYMHVFACRPDKGSHVVQTERPDYLKFSEKLEDVTCGACLTSPLRKEAERNQKRRLCDKIHNDISALNRRCDLVYSIKRDGMWRRMPQTGRDALNASVEAIKVQVKRLQDRRTKLQEEINAPR